VLAASIAACTSAVELAPPDVPGAKSVLVATVDFYGKLKMTADDWPPTEQVTLDRQRDRLMLIVYRVGLDELSLTRGKVACDAPEPSQLLPRPDAFYEIAPGTASWTPGEQLPICRIPQLGPMVCLKIGGCLGAQGQCVTPCPQPPAPIPPEPPNPPAPPILSPCPTHWTETASGAARFCAPPAALSADRCGGDLALDCTSTLTWSPRLPNNAPILYVKPGATGGSGTRSAPLGTIAEALARAQSGDIIALGSGVFTEDVSISTDLTLWGSCASTTTIAGDIDVVASGPVAIRELTVSAPPRGIRAENAHLSLDSIVVSGAGATGLDASGGRLDASNLRVCRSAANGAVLDNATSTLDRAVFWGNAPDALVVKGGSAAVSDLWAEGNVGGGLVFSATSSVDARRIYVSNAVERGIACLASTVHLTDAMVVNTLGSAGSLGYPLRVRGGGNEPLPASAHLTARRIAALVNDAGVEISLAATASISDMTIHGVTHGTDQYTAGLSIAVATVSLSRLEIKKVSSSGVVVGSSVQAHCSGDDPPTVVSIEDLSVDTVAAGITGEGGGYYMNCNTHLFMNRARLANFPCTGFYTNNLSGNGPGFDIKNLEVIGAGYNGVDITRGKGRFDRVRITGPGRYGIHAGETATVTLSNVEIASSQTALAGLHSDCTATASTSRFLVHDLPVGAQVQGSSMIRLYNGELRHDCVGIKAYKPEQIGDLLHGVLFEDNAQDLDQSP
jgi:hypothetical protein